MMNLRAQLVEYLATGAGRGDTLMQQHGPNGMGGPLRGTAVWWHALRQAAEAGRAPEVQTCPSPTHEIGDNDPTIRKVLVDRVRREIAAGDYDTQERWEAALDRLLDRIYRD